MSLISILNIFKDNLVGFFDDLIALFPSEGDLLYVRIFLKDRVPIQDVMNEFIETLTADEGRVKKLIAERNDIFFLEPNIFDSFSSDKAQHFKKLWLSPEINDDERRVIWEWLDGFVAIVDKYMKITKK